MNDQTIEQEIQAKGLTAPRVTPADIEANIDREYYFTAANGVDGWDIHVARVESPREPLTIMPFIEDPDTPQLAPLRLLTFCVLVTKNGFTFTGESACASPENFDTEIGRKIARQNAVAKMWMPMGYALKQRLAEG